VVLKGCTRDALKELEKEEIEVVQVAILQTCINKLRYLMSSPGDNVSFRRLMLKMSMYRFTSDPPLPCSKLVLESCEEGWRYLYDDEKAGRIIKLAQAGDQDADAALCDLGAAFIDCDHALPPMLRTYVVDRLRSSDEIRARSERRGRKKCTNIRRNFAIVAIMAWLMDIGYQPTRNDTTEGECASSLTVKALASIDIKLSEATVRRIWAKDAYLFNFLAR
jgi:hypothetical protein